MDMDETIHRRMVSAGFDCHKKQHTFGILTPDGCLSGPRKQIPITKAGFDLARDTLTAAKIKYNAQEVRIGVEATSFYHLNIVSYLKQYFKDIRVFNPKLGLGRHRREIRPKKDDHRDALNIAIAVHEGVRGSMPYEDTALLDIQELCRFNSRLVKNRSALKKRFERNLHVLFPGYDLKVKNVFKPVSARLLGRYPSAEALRNVPFEELRAVTRTKGKYGFRDKTIQELVGLANNVPDTRYYREALLIEQKELLDLIQSYDRRIKRVTRQALNRWRELGIHPRYFDIPGLREDYAVGFYAETGPISRFPSSDTLVAFLGLDPIVKRTDTHVTYGHISKMGTRYGREILGNAVVAMRKANPVIGEVWKKAKAHGRRYNERRVMAMRKLARIIYGIENNPR